MPTHTHRQQGSIFHRSEKRDGRTVVSPDWTIKFRDASGKQKWITVGPSKKAATKLLQEKLTELQHGTYAEVVPVTFAEYAAQWLARRKPELKPSGYRTYEGLLGLRPGRVPRKAPAPVAYFGAKPLDTVRPEDIATYLGVLTAAGWKRKTVINLRTCLSTLFEDARAARPPYYTGPNPTKNRLVKVPKATTPGQLSVERVVPTAEQVMALLDYLDVKHPDLYGFCMTMAGTGMRPGEVCGLQVGDLNRVDGTIEVRRAIDPRAPLAQQVILPKTNVSRTVDASPQVFAALDRCLQLRFGDPAQAPADAYVLGGTDGQPLDIEWWRRSRGWSRALVAAGVGAFGMYSLRHFYASRLLAAGEPLAYVQKQLGHANQNMTLSHYSRFIPDTRRARGADRLMAELLATDPQPNEAPRSRTKLDGGEVPAVQGLTKAGEAARSRTRRT